MSQRRFAILRANIGRELDNPERLVAEAEEWRPHPRRETSPWLCRAKQPE
jgi:hypothetical protein